MPGQLQPLEIPAGVVSMPTKRMRSSNWSEVNAIRWIEGQMQPIGGQEKINYSFASRCRKVHTWYDLTGQIYIAYLCETNVYVDKQGALTEITPTGGIQPPPTPTGGFGLGDMGLGLYGAPPRPGSGNEVSLSILPPAYSMDNFGAILMVMSSTDGRLLWWDPGAVAGTLLTQVPATAGGNAGKSPLGHCFCITPDRFVMIFGMYSDGSPAAPTVPGRRFGWSDQEHPQNWDFASTTTQAGFFDIEPASPIVAAHAGRAGWVVFFTAKRAYVTRYLGLPYVYDYEVLADDVTPWSPQSITSTSQALMWMSQQGSWTFDGTSITPIPCQVRTWITDDIDPLQVRFQACAAHLGAFNELWWFFPELGQTFNTRAVVYNYREGWWSQARMPRSAGVTSSYTTSAIFADGQQPYRHESGVYFNDCDLPWADTFSLNLSSGGNLTTLKQMLVDLDGDPTNLHYQLYTRMTRLGREVEQITTPKVIRPDGFVDFRTTARDIRLRCAVIGPAVPAFTLGQHLIDVAQRGQR
ncbi:MAG TPA: hypothetical protein VGG68_00085 [Caulobacteraceae bacterium]